jgi:hypothetical protein
MAEEVSCCWKLVLGVGANQGVIDAMTERRVYLLSRLGIQASRHFNAECN